MRLHWNWRYLLKRSWSVRWSAVASVLSGAEVIMPLFESALPRGTFAVLAFACTCGAVWARVLIQPKDGL